MEIVFKEAFSYFKNVRNNVLLVHEHFETPFLEYLEHLKQSAKATLCKMQLKLSSNKLH